MNQFANNTPRYTLNKSEILRHKKVIRELFKSGSSFLIYPIKIIFEIKPEGQHQVLFSVPLKKFKKAVERNKIRRRLKEAYRLNKHILNINENDKAKLNIAYIYISEQILPFNFLQDKMIESLKKLANKIT